MLGAFLITGCLSKKPLNKESFAFSIPDAKPFASSTNAPILTIRRIAIMPPFDSPSLTYRTGEFSYERDSYAGFLVAPADCLSEPIRAMLRNSGKFSGVIDTESALRGNLDLEVSAEQLYGDFRDKEHPAAVLEMHFVVYNSITTSRLSKTSPTVLVQKSYTRRVLLKSRTAAAVVAALNDALHQIVMQFASDIPKQ